MQITPSGYFLLNLALILIQFPFHDDVDEQNRYKSIGRTGLSESSMAETNRGSGI